MIGFVSLTIAATLPRRGLTLPRLLSLPFQRQRRAFFEAAVTIGALPGQTSTR